MKDSRQTALNLRWVGLGLAALFLCAGCILDTDLGKAPKGESASDSGETASLWTEVAPMLTGRSQHASAVFNGKIYVFGGKSAAGGLLDSVEEYDPALNVWTARATMLTHRYDLAACALDQSIYVLGGQGTSTVVEAYDPAANSWSTRNALPGDCSQCRCGTVSAKLYAVVSAGAQGGAQIPPSATEYNPVNDSWAVKASYTTIALQRSGAAAASFNSQLLLVGGSQQSGGSQRFAGVLAFHPASNAWSELPAMPTARDGLAAAASETRLFAIGGNYDNPTSGDNPGITEAVVEAFDLTGNAWSAKAGLPIYSLSNHTAEAVAGLVYVLGGNSATQNPDTGPTTITAISTVLSYDPASEP